MMNPSLILYGNATYSDIQFMDSSSSNYSNTYSAGFVAESASPNYTDLFNQISTECLRLVGLMDREIPP
jgi:hypothetical protein